jgi:hypothetical protein
MAMITSFVIVRHRRKQGSRRIPLNQIAQNVRQDAGQFFGSIISLVRVVVWFVIAGLWLVVAAEKWMWQHS